MSDDKWKEPSKEDLAATARDLREASECMLRGAQAVDRIRARDVASGMPGEIVSQITGVVGNLLTNAALFAVGATLFGGLSGIAKDELDKAAATKDEIDRLTATWGKGEPPAPLRPPVDGK